ncbi:MAG: hypothetical protein KatS3mg077_2611 [Candidatus Binatia bacterium]|nr:MAG: hypothetical protein KatS3mg077_2611 [Candidatus Binatia bacterium]
MDWARRAGLVLVLALWLAHCGAKVADERRCSDLELSLVDLVLADPNLPPSYRAYMEAGGCHLLGGNFAAAAEAFEAALRQPLHEAPNYEAVIFLAKARCLAGETDTGLRLLLDFECMLDVELGVQPCFVATHDARLLRNPRLTAMCFNVMCSEMYLSYYANPTRETRERVSRFRDEVIKVRELCSRYASLTSDNGSVEFPR